MNLSFPQSSPLERAEGEVKNWPFSNNRKVFGQIQEVNLVNPDYPAHFCTPLEIEVYQIIL